MSYCDNCGWAEANHRPTPAGKLCPYQRTKKGKPTSFFAPKPGPAAVSA